MRTFDVTLKGFDGGTDKTDHLVKWIRASNRQILDQWLEKTGIAEVVDDIRDIADYALCFEEGIDVRLLENFDVANSNPNISSLVIQNCDDYFQITKEEFDPKVWIEESKAITQ